MNRLTRSLPVNGEPIPQLSVDLRSAVRVVIVCSVVILVISYVRLWILLTYGTGTIIGEFRLFNLDGELTIPSWYSAVILLACSGLLLAISRLAKQTGQGDVVRWVVLSVGFAVMGLDEWLAFHESTTIPLRTAFGLSGIFYFAWVIPGAAIVVVIGAYMVPLLFRLPPRTAIWFVASAIIYVGGALGVESVGGLITSAGGFGSMQYVLVGAVEETLETIGFTMFFAALVDYLGRTWPSWTLRLGAPLENEKAASQVAIPEEVETT